MRTLDSSPDLALAASVAMRPSDAAGNALRVEELGEVAVTSGALYLGPRSGANGVDGVVMRVPNGAYRVVATRAGVGGEVLAISVRLGASDEAMRDALPGAAYWHDAPGDLPLLAGDALVASDAALRDQHQSGGWPWEGWLRDVADPALAAASSAGRAGVPVPYPGRAEAIVVSAPIAGEVALFAAFDGEGRPVAVHLERLGTATAPGGVPSDASHNPWARDAAEAETPPPWVGGGATDAPGAPAFAGTFALSSATGGRDDDVRIFASPLGPLGDDASPDADENTSADGNTSADASLAADAPHDAPSSAAAPDPAAAPTATPAPATAPAPTATATATAGPSPAPRQVSPAAPAAAESSDAGAEQLVADALAGVDAADRGDAATAVPLLGRVTDALAQGLGERPAVRVALERHELTGAQLVDTLVDVLVREGRVDDALHALRTSLEAPTLRLSGLETLHLRRRFGELQLRSGDARSAVTTLDRARVEAEALAHGAGGDAEAAEFGRDYLAHVTYDLANARLQTGDATTSAAHAAAAMEQFELQRHARMAGRSAFLAASAYEALQHEASRQQALADAERIFRAGGELDGLGTALGFLGEADANRGEYLAALTKFEEARAVLEEAGELGNAATAAHNEAVCLDHLGQHDEANRRRVVAGELEACATHGHDKA